MEYKIKDVCKTLNFGVSKFYRLKEFLDNSIPEQNRTEFYYNKGRNFYITDKGLEWFKNNLGNSSDCPNKKNGFNSDIIPYQNQLIEFYKQRIEYLENENKRLLDIISLKEQKELAKDVKLIDNREPNSFFSRFIRIFKSNDKE